MLSGGRSPRGRCGVAAAALVVGLRAIRHVFVALGRVARWLTRRYTLLCCQAPGREGRSSTAGSDLRSQSFKYGHNGEVMPPTEDLFSPAVHMAPQRRERRVRAAAQRRRAALKKKRLAANNRICAMP